MADSDKRPSFTVVMMQETTGGYTTVCFTLAINRSHHEANLSHRRINLQTCYCTKTHLNCSKINKASGVKTFYGFKIKKLIQKDVFRVIKDQIVC